jgi:hypothetical protein
MPGDLLPAAPPYDDLIIDEEVFSARRVILRRETWETLGRAAGGPRPGEPVEVARAILEAWPKLGDRIEAELVALLERHEPARGWSSPEVALLLRIVLSKLGVSP